MLVQILRLLIEWLGLIFYKIVDYFFELVKKLLFAEEVENLLIKKNVHLHRFGKILHGSILWTSY